MEAEGPCTSCNIIRSDNNMASILGYQMQVDSMDDPSMPLSCAEPGEEAVQPPHANTPIKHVPKSSFPTRHFNFPNSAPNSYKAAEYSSGNSVLAQSNKKRDDDIYSHSKPVAAAPKSASTPRFRLNMPQRSTISQECARDSENLTPETSPLEVPSVRASSASYPPSSSLSNKLSIPAIPSSMSGVPARNKTAVASPVTDKLTVPQVSTALKAKMPPFPSPSGVSASVGAATSTARPKPVPSPLHVAYTQASKISSPPDLESSIISPQRSDGEQHDFQFKVPVKSFRQMDANSSASVESFGQTPPTVAPEINRKSKEESLKRPADFDHLDGTLPTNTEAAATENMEWNSNNSALISSSISSENVSSIYQPPPVITISTHPEEMSVAGSGGAVFLPNSGMDQSIDTTPGVIMLAAEDMGHQGMQYQQQQQVGSYPQEVEYGQQPVSESQGFPTNQNMV